MDEALTILAAAVCCPAPERLAPFAVPAEPPDKSLLPPAIRRRTGLTTQMAVTAATRACHHAGIAASAMPSVFASVGGEIQVTDRLCRALADPDGIISPTQFHNSVHNTTAGYWTIINGCHASTTAIAALDDTFAIGLLEAWSQTQAAPEPLLLVCYDETWPPYLAPPIGDEALAVALVVRAHSAKSGPAIARPCQRTGSRRFSPELATLAEKAPAAAAIPLLQAFTGETAKADIPLNDGAICWRTELIVDSAAGQHDRSEHS